MENKRIYTDVLPKQPRVKFEDAVGDYMGLANKLHGLQCHLGPEKELEMGDAMGALAVVIDSIDGRFGKIGHA